MKKIISTLILLGFFSIILLITILTTTGFETNRFNNLISKKINQANNNINLELTTIKFKLDIKEFSLFLETINSQIDYRSTIIPAKNIKVYMDFISLIKSEPKFKKINLIFNQLDIEQLQKISTTFKPSNFTSFVNNKVKQGKLNVKLEIYLDDNNLFDNFIAKGSVSNLKAEIIDNINLQKTNFSFFADKTDVLIKNISSEIGPIKITEGDLKLISSPEISLESNFKTNIKYNDKLTNYANLIKDLDFTKNIVSLEGNLNNSFFINFDKTYKVEEYNYKNNGIIKKANLDFKKPLENYFLEEKINKLSVINSEIRTNFSPKKNTTNISGKYSLNNSNNLLFNLEHIIDKELLKLKLDADIDRPIKLEIINYQKLNNSIANLSIKLEKQKDKTKINKINLTEGNNSFII